MELTNKVVVVTGAASGIGEAMARRFAAEAPSGLVLADLNLEAAQSVATDVGGIAIETDVSSASDNKNLVGTTEERFGPIDLFCANAGYGVAGDEQSDPD